MFPVEYTTVVRMVVPGAVPPNIAYVYKYVHTYMYIYVYDYKWMFI